MNDVQTRHRIESRRFAASTPKSYVTAAIVRALVGVAEARGVDVDRILDEVGISRTALAAPDAYVACAIEHRIWERVLDEVDCVNFGPAVAEAIARGDFQEVEYVFRTSATLADAFRAFARYNAILHGAPIFELKTDGDFVLRYLEPHGRGTRVADTAAAFALTSVLRVARSATSYAWSPREVRVDFADPRHVEALSAAIGAPVVVTSASPEIVIPQDVLQLPMRDADPVLCDVLERGLRHKIDDFVPPPTSTALVRQTLEANLDDGDALTVTKCGARMGLSPRTLQDRLQREGVTFQQLLREIREERARQMLAGSESVQDIAIALDYADTRAFRRAFKRWTKTTPSEYRRRLRRGPALVAPGP